MFLFPRACDFFKYLRPLLVTFFAPKKQVLLAGQYHLLLSNIKVSRSDFWTYIQQSRYTTAILPKEISKCPLSLSNLKIGSPFINIHSSSSPQINYHRIYINGVLIV